MQMETKMSRSNYTHIRKNRFNQKLSNKTKKITYKVIIYQEDNNHKYICDQH